MNWTPYPNYYPPEDTRQVRGGPIVPGDRVEVGMTEAGDDEVKAVGALTVDVTAARGEHLTGRVVRVVTTRQPSLVDDFRPGQELHFGAEHVHAIADAN